MNYFDTGYAELDFKGYSPWDKDGQYRDITWLDAAFSAQGDDRVFYWIDNRSAA